MKCRKIDHAAANVPKTTTVYGSVRATNSQHQTLGFRGLTIEDFQSPAKRQHPPRATQQRIGYSQQHRSRAQHAMRTLCPICFVGSERQLIRLDRRRPPETFKLRWQKGPTMNCLCRGYRNTPRVFAPLSNIVKPYLS